MRRKREGNGDLGTRRLPWRIGRWGRGQGRRRVQTCVHKWRFRNKPYDVLSPFGFFPSFVSEAMGWATATANKAEVTTATDTITEDKIYSGGAEAEDADEDANYSPPPSSRGGPSTSASSVAAKRAHLALPDGFYLFWDNDRENEN